jgi:hypothetical protein
MWLEAKRVFWGSWTGGPGGGGEGRRTENRHGCDGHQRVDPVILDVFLSARESSATVVTSSNFSFVNPRRADKHVRVGIDG